MYMAQLLGAVRNVGPYWAIADELQCVVEYKVCMAVPAQVP